MATKTLSARQLSLIYTLFSVLPERRSRLGLKHRNVLCVGRLATSHSRDQRQRLTALIARVRIQPSGCALEMNEMTR